MITVSMIVRNEEELLGRCLESVKEMGEVVILDTGSTDHTRLVAEGCGAKIIMDKYKWKDDFSDARNEAMKYAEGDWIFIIDADEYLEPGGAEKIKKFAEEQPDDVDVIGVWCKAENQDTYCNQPRLFRNKKGIHYSHPAHNALSKVSTVTIPKEQVKLIYGRSPNHDKDPERTLRILRNTIMEGRATPRELFYYARELSYFERWEGTYYWGKKYLSQRKTWVPERAEVSLLMAKACIHLQEWSEAKEFCAKTIALNPNFAEAYKFMAWLQRNSDQKKFWEDLGMKATNEGVLFVREVEFN